MLTSASPSIQSMIEAGLGIAVLLISISRQHDAGPRDRGLAARPGDRRFSRPMTRDCHPAGLSTSSFPKSFRRRHWQLALRDLNRGCVTFDERNTTPRD